MKRPNQHTVSFAFSDQKMEALVLYLEDKGLSFEEKLAEKVEEIYEKNVPKELQKHFKLLEEREKKATAANTNLSSD